MTKAEIKALVRKRDGHRCTECGMPAEDHVRMYRNGLEVHRLTPGSEYTLEGCTTLCKPCHGRQPKRTPRPRLRSKMTGTLCFVADAQRIREFAKRWGLSLSAYIRVAVNEKMQRDAQMDVPEPRPRKKKAPQE